MSHSCLDDLITEHAQAILIAENHKLFESSSGVFNSSEKAAAQSGICRSLINIRANRLLDIIEKARQDPTTKIENFVREVNLASAATEK